MNYYINDYNGDNKIESRRVDIRKRKIEIEQKTLHSNKKLVHL